MEHVGEEKAELFDSREEVEEFFNFMDRDYDGNLSFEVFDWRKCKTKQLQNLYFVGVYGRRVNYRTTL